MLMMVSAWTDSSGTLSIFLFLRIQFSVYLQPAQANRGDRTERYYPLSSFLTLFAHTLDDPMDASVPADLQLMERVISVLSPTMGEVGPFSATTAFQIFQELLNVTKRFVEQKTSQETRIIKRSYEVDVTRHLEDPLMLSAGGTIPEESVGSMVSHLSLSVK
jgi:hypothetical protein